MGKLFVNHRLCAIILLLLLNSCRSASKPDKDTFIDRNVDIIPLNEGSADQVPSFLWSPSQRKMNASYYYLVSEYMLTNGEVSSATSLLERAYNLDPNPFVGGKLLSLKAYTENPSDLLNDARRMVLMYPKFYRLKLYYAQILARAGKYDQAIESLEEGIRLNDKDEQLYLELIDIHQRLRKPTKALVIAKDLIAHISDSVPGWLVLAKLYIVTSQKKEALQAAERAYQLQGTNAEILLVYALALEMNNQSQKAIALYEQLYRLNPANEELIGKMVALYRQLGDLNVALELLDELSKLPSGKRPGVQIQRAIIMWELERNEEAAGILAQLAKDFPASERVTYLNGLANEKLGRRDEALRYYELIPESASLRLEADFRRAVVLKGQEKYDLAMAAIEKSLDHENVSWEYFALAAEIKSLGKDYQSSIDIVSKGYKKFPDKHRLLFLKGVYQEKDGQVDECIETMRVMIKVEPNNSGALNYLGYLFVESGENLDEALVLIKRALKIKPNDPYYIDSLGWAYFQKGQLEEAEVNLLKALSLAPDEGVILEHLGEVALKKNDKVKAKAYYDKAIKSKLEQRDRERIESRYEQLFGSS